MVSKHFQFAIISADSEIFRKEGISQTDLLQWKHPIIAPRLDSVSSLKGDVCKGRLKTPVENMHVCTNLKQSIYDGQAAINL